MPKKIHTILGEVEDKNINRTMIHEHLVLDLTRSRGDDVSILGDESTLSFIEAELKQLLVHGFDTIVEQTNIGMGRSPTVLKRIVEDVGVNIIAGTGYYKESFFPEEISVLSEEEIASRMTNDIVFGMNDQGLKAGLYGEIGSSLNEFTFLERKVFRSVCISHRETKAPISTHCEMGTMAVEQMRFFDQQGINPEKISFGHQDLNTSLISQLELLKWGAYIQYDTIGKTRYRPDEERIRSLLHLLEAGYEDRIMISCDITRKTYLKAFGGHGYVSIYETFLPMLKAYGISNDILDKMLVQNPRKFLAF